MKYRKKPVTVEAIQWIDGNMREIMSFAGKNAIWDERTQTMYIETLEGCHIAHIGDYIIRGIAGEYYPCKPDIFAATYEEALDA